MRLRRSLPLDLVASIAIVVAPLAAAAVLLDGSTGAPGGGAALVEASDVRSALFDLAFVVDQARVAQDVSLVDTAIDTVTQRRADLEGALTPALATGAVMRDLSTFDRATSELAWFAQAYAGGTRAIGAGDTAFSGANHALDDLLRDLAGAVDGAAAARQRVDLEALGLMLASALAAAMELGWLWWRRRRTHVRAEWFRRRWHDSAATLPDVLYGTDAQGRFTFVTDAVTAVLGWDPSQLVGHPIGEFLLATHGEPVEAGDGVRGFDATWRRHDGTEVRVLTRELTRADDDGVAAGTTGVIQDPRPANAIAEALRESEARFRHTLDTAQNGMMIVSPEGRLILHWSALAPARQRACRTRPAHLGRTPSQLQA